MSNSSRRILLAFGAVVAGLLLLWVLAYWLSGSGVPRGTTVLGVQIGGMSKAQAAARLDRELRDEARAKVAVRIGDVAARFGPRAAGLGLDSEATVDQAAERSWQPLRLIDRLRGGGEIAPVTTVRADRLEAAVARLARRVDGEPVEGDVTFEDGKVVTVQPRTGVRLDQPGAFEAITSSYLQQDEPITLPAEVEQPEVGAAEVRRAVGEFAAPAMAAPVVLVVEGRRTTVPARVIGAALSMTPDEEHLLRPTLDGEKLKKGLETAGIVGGLEREARDASFRIVDGRPKVVRAARGREIDPVELRAAVLPVLTKDPGPERVASVVLRRSDPELTTQEAAALGVDELVSEYTTYYPSDFAPRLTNIHRAADLMDGTLVLPGKTFSLNDAVGERTAERGFAAGYIISGGKLEVDYGGGVSQLATTTFNAAFFAGLEDVEHHPHSFYISRYPEGREATVAWGVKDLRFRNDSGHGLFVTTAYTDGSVTVQIWGTKRYDITSRKSDRYEVKPFQTIHDPRPAGTTPGSCVLQEGVPGFKVDVTRIFRENGQRVRTESFHTVYQPEDRIICGSRR